MTRRSRAGTAAAMNLFAEFLITECEESDDLEVSLMEVCDAYREWVKKYFKSGSIPAWCNFDQATVRNWLIRYAEFGHESRQTSLGKRTYIKGLRLKPREESEPEAGPIKDSATHCVIDGFVLSRDIIAAVQPIRPFVKANTGVTATHIIIWKSDYAHLKRMYISLQQAERLKEYLLS